MMVTPELIAHRAAQLGLDPFKALGRHDLIKTLCQDSTAGSALARLTWRLGPDGQRHRRTGFFGRFDPFTGHEQPDPWISDAMIDAAEAYGSLWKRWQRLNALPNRTPKCQQFERKDGGGGGGDPFEASAAQAHRVRTLLDQCRQAITVCPDPGAVLSVLDLVIIENRLPDTELEAALDPLRRGLDALWGVLCQPRKRQKAA